MLDVDFGDLIDYFGMDMETRAILIYLESLGTSMDNAKRFMSAAAALPVTNPLS